MTPRSVVITLTDAELAQVAFCAGLRRCSSVGLQPAHGLDEATIDPWSQECNSLAAELAVAKATGRYWCGGINTFKGHDVVGLQVRSTTHPLGCLLVRPGDSDLDVFFLVTGKIPTFELHGYMRGGEAKNALWRRAPNARDAAYFVPQEALHPMGPLVEAADLHLRYAISDAELEDQERRAIAEER